MDTKTTPSNTFDARAFVAQCGSTSQAIRALDKQGFDRSEIALLLGKKYQHVRNVLITPVKNPGAKGHGKGKKQLSTDTLKRAAALVK